MAEFSESIRDLNAPQRVYAITLEFRGDVAAAFVGDVEMFQMSIINRMLYVVPPPELTSIFNAWNGVLKIAIPDPNKEGAHDGNRMGRRGGRTDPPTERTGTA